MGCASSKQNAKSPANQGKAIIATPNNKQNVEKPQISQDTNKKSLLVIPVIQKQTNATIVKKPSPPQNKNYTLAEIKAIKPIQVENGPNYEAENKIFAQILEKYRINVLDYSSILPVSQAASKANVSGVGAQRLNKEVIQLAKNLPIDKSNSIFCSQDSKKTSHLRSIVTGPKNTSYAFGCFLFDIQCNEQYPNKPPVVLGLTTGGATIRFNPNLYKAGKVCLSLLGTWSGTGGENWTQKSNIYQVLISIQSLIMGDGIAYKEPGYGPTTVDLVRQNQGYENIIRLSTIQFAMVDMLRNPPKDFLEVIQMHFYLNKDIIMRQVQVWVDDAKQPIIKPLYSGICSSQNYNLAQKFTKENQYYTSIVAQQKILLEEFKKLEITIQSNKIYLKFQNEIQNQTKQQDMQEEAKENKIETKDDKDKQDDEKNQNLNYSYDKMKKSVADYIVSQKQKQTQNNLDDAQQQKNEALEKMIKQELVARQQQINGQTDILPAFRPLKQQQSNEFTEIFPAFRPLKYNTNSKSQNDQNSHKKQGNQNTKLKNNRNRIFSDFIIKKQKNISIQKNQQYQNEEISKSENYIKKTYQTIFSEPNTQQKDQINKNSKINKSDNHLIISENMKKSDKQNNIHKNDEISKNQSAENFKQSCSSLFQSIEEKPSTKNIINEENSYVNSGQKNQLRKVSQSCIEYAQLNL